MKIIYTKPKGRSVAELKDYDYIVYMNEKFKREYKVLMHKKGVHYYQLSDNFLPEKDKSFFYKYMDLESALLSLRNKNLRFVEPTRWEDKYEGRFYNADYTNVSKNPDDTPFLYACCMSVKPHNEAAWKVYTYGKVGLGAHCVQFKINRFKFRNELIKSKKVKRGYTIFEGLVTYTSELTLNNLHKPNFSTESKGKSKDNNYYKCFFSSFGLCHYLNLLLLKRDYFKYESEIRFFIRPPKAPQPKAKKSQKNGVTVYGKDEFFDIDWANVIDEIRIDSHCTQLEYDIFKDACLELLRSSDRYTSCKKREQKELEKIFTPVKTDVYGKRHSVTIKKLAT